MSKGKGINRKKLVPFVLPIFIFSQNPMQRIFEKQTERKASRKEFFGKNFGKLFFYYIGKIFWIIRWFYRDKSKGIIIAQKSKVKYMQYIQNNYNEKRINIQYKQDVLM